jgi:hypothetical protein
MYPKRAPAQLPDSHSTSPVALRIVDDANPRRPVAGRHQTEFETSLPFDYTDHDGAVELLDLVFSKCRTQSLPDILASREQKYARGVYVQSMDNPTPQTPFSYTVDFGEPGDQHIQHGVGLVCVKRMDRGSGRFVDGEPAWAATEHRKRAIRCRNCSFVLAPCERSHLDNGAGLEIPALGIFGDIAPCDAHSAAREQAANL